MYNGATLHFERAFHKGMTTTVRPRRDLGALKARRRYAAALFAGGQSEPAVVRLLKVSRQTSSRCLRARLGFLDESEVSARRQVWQVPRRVRHDVDLARVLSPNAGLF